MGVIGHWSLVIGWRPVLFTVSIGAGVGIGIGIDLGSVPFLKRVRKGSERFFHHLSIVQFAHLTIITEVKAPNI
jgi:hypothetical protein